MLGDTNRLKGGAYEQTNIRQCGRKIGFVHYIILPVEYGANDALVLGPL